MSQFKTKLDFTLNEIDINNCGWEVTKTKKDTKNIWLKSFEKKKHYMDDTFKESKMTK